jgi:CO/xanthine dehydrogenase Mo-binding subunit
MLTETTLTQPSPIGQAVQRVDGYGKVVGGTVYAPDLVLRQNPKLAALFTESTWVV